MKKQVYEIKLRKARRRRRRERKLCAVATIILTMIAGICIANFLSTPEVFSTTMRKDLRSHRDDKYHDYYIEVYLEKDKFLYNDDYELEEYLHLKADNEYLINYALDEYHKYVEEGNKPSIKKFVKERNILNLVK